MKDFPRRVLQQTVQKGDVVERVRSYRIKERIQQANQRGELSQERKINRELAVLCVVERPTGRCDDELHGVMVLLNSCKQIFVTSEHPPLGPG